MIFGRQKYKYLTLLEIKVKIIQEEVYNIIIFNIYNQNILNLFYYSTKYKNWVLMFLSVFHFIPYK